MNNNTSKWWYKAITNKRLQSFVLQLSALLFVNSAAFLFDAQWIQYAVAADMFVLGLNVGDMVKR